MKSIILGGPLICQMKSTRKWYLAGITSWGADICDIDKPTVFTKVQYYADFLTRQ